MYILSASDSEAFWSKNEFVEASVDKWPEEIHDLYQKTAKESLISQVNDNTVPMFVIEDFTNGVFVPGGISKQWSKMANLWEKVTRSQKDEYPSKTQQKVRNWEYEQRKQHALRGVPGMHSTLTDERLTYLLSIGFSFNPIKDSWETMFSAAAKGKGTDVSSKQITNWLYDQRRLFQKEEPTDEDKYKMAKLQSINYKLPIPKGRQDQGLPILEQHLQMIQDWLREYNTTSVPQAAVVLVEGKEFQIGTKYRNLKAEYLKLLEKKKNNEKLTRYQEERMEAIVKYLDVSQWRKREKVRKTTPSNASTGSESTSNRTTSKITKHRAIRMNARISKALQTKGAGGAMDTESDNGSSEQCDSSQSRSRDSSVQSCSKTTKQHQRKNGGNKQQQVRNNDNSAKVSKATKKTSNEKKQGYFSFIQCND